MYTQTNILIHTYVPAYVLTPHHTTDTHSYAQTYTQHTQTL